MRFKRWISSIKRTSPSSRLVRMAAKSPVRSIAGPLVVLICTPSSLATTVANVVFPKPGGPENKIWSTTSLRARAAPMRIERLSFTFFCPKYSSRHVGLKLRSRARSSSIRETEQAREAASPSRDESASFKASKGASNSALSISKSSCKDESTFLSIISLNALRRIAIVSFRLLPREPP